MDNCTSIWAPIELSYVTFGISLVIMLFAITGNFLIILAVIWNPNYNLRSPFNFFLVNLSVSDLLLGGVVLPIMCVVHYQEAIKVQSATTSAVLHMSILISTGAGTLNIVVMCLDRCAAVWWPITYRQHISTKRSLLISAFVWVVATSLSVPYFQLGYIKFLIIVTHASLVLTFVVLLVAYIGVYRTLKKRNFFHRESSVTLPRKPREIQQECSSPCSSIKPILNSDGNCPARTNNTLLRRARASVSSISSPRNLSRVYRSQAKILQSFISIIFIFLLTGIPILVLIYLLQFCESCSCHTKHIFRDSVSLLLVVSSAINPFVGAFKMNRFRRAWRKIFCSRHLNRKESVTSFGSRRRFIRRSVGEQV